MNPSRVTNADIDTDYAGKDRDTVKQFLLRDKMGLPTIHSSEIITFNTIKLKGAIRDVCRALYKDDEKVNYLELASSICKEAELHEDSARKKYQNVFEYVDIINGTIVSIGTHPSGVLISELPIEQTIGLCSVSTSDYPVSMINMKELDDQMYVKLDILGVDNIGIINDTCSMLGIERLTPDNTNLEDEAVWRSIRDDTTMIFQWESDGAQAYIRKFMSDKTVAIAKERIPGFSMLKWLSFGNGLIRPACASFRESVANGEFYDNGFDALNEFLAPEAGRIAMQETIMRFLVKFCGYSDAESDTVRRGIAKKKGTEVFLPEIERRFIKFCTEHYGLTEQRCEEIIKPFLQLVLDASSYAFSWNHSDSYSATGYICGYLRYYHPLEFLTAALNIASDKQDKTAEIVKYASKVGINITMPKWGISRSGYSFDRDSNTIAKGLASVKYMNAAIAEELYGLSQQKHYHRFIELLADIDERTSVNTRQLDILIRLDFFSPFGNQRELLRITELFYDLFKKGQAKKLQKDRIDGTPLEPIVQKYAVGSTKAGQMSKSYTLLDVASIMRETEDAVKASGIEDVDDIVKVRSFADVMGYVGYISGKESDRRKLYILDIFPVFRKRDGKQFGYSILAKSIGSGKESRFTIFNRVYERDPVQKGDIVLCVLYEHDFGKYFTLNEYKKIT